MRGLERVGRNLILLFLGITLGSGVVGGAAAGVVVASAGPPRVGALADIPTAYLVLYQAAGAAYGVPWQILAGIFRWASGNPQPDVNNPRDAIFAAAAYLRVAGAPGNIPRAIYAYNHAWWYVDLVLRQARAYGYPG